MHFYRKKVQSFAADSQLEASLMVAFGDSPDPELLDKLAESTSGAIRNWMQLLFYTPE